MYNSNNIFAKIIRKELPAKVIFEDKEIIAINDINPIAPVHILVIPKSEHISFHDFAKQDAVTIGNFFRKVQQIAESQGLDKNGYRIIFNHGTDAMQTVEHFHAHIIAGKKLGSL